MRYDNPNTRDALAAEYVLGTLRGGARRRFETLVATRSDWKFAASWWSSRLHLLADTAPAVAPRKQVWQSIETRLYGNKLPSTPSWWRMLALGSTGITAALAILMITRAPEVIEVPVKVAVNVPVEVPVPATVALLAGADSKPGWMLALAKNKTGQSEVRVTALASLKLASDKSFELWILPPDKSAPVSLGLLPQHGNQQLVVSAKTAALLQQSGLAVSLEPVGGSPTGQPTGAVLYQGKLTEI
ncbi:MAG: anti-sigma factor [Bacteroidia bacterium]|nr:anti-sigma factor [Methylotenera sp.]